MKDRELLEETHQELAKLQTTLARNTRTWIKVGNIMHRIGLQLKNVSPEDCTLCSVPGCQEMATFFNSGADYCADCWDKEVTV